MSSETVSGPELLAQVKKQVDFYFSQANLSSDAYLTSNLDREFSVSLEFLLNFPKMKTLQATAEVLRQAVTESSLVTLENDRVKLISKPFVRNTIILREVPTDITEAEVREVFNYAGAKTIESVRPAGGALPDLWYIVFETEDAAKDTLLDLKLHRRKIRGELVKARIKTESLLRSSPVPVNAVTVPLDANAPMNYLPTVEIPVDPKPEKAEKRSSTRSRRNENSSRKNADATRRAGVTKAAKASDITETAASKPVVPLIVNESNFPSLADAVDNSPLPVPGYQGDYVKYSLVEIISIVKGVNEAAMPKEVNADKHTIAMTSSPNLDLLQRQRTYSIDETREQLRQGRPVQRDAVISGSVDYRSMMYGDDSRSRAGTGVSVDNASVDESTMRVSSSTWAAMVKVAAAATTPAPALVAAAPVEEPVKVVAPVEAVPVMVAAPEAEVEATTTTEAAAETTSAWSGKASFASLLK